MRRERGSGITGSQFSDPVANPLSEYVFLSPEWVHEVTRTVQLARKDDRYFRNLASGFSLSWVYVVRNIPSGLRRHYGGDDQAVIFLRVDKGIVREVEIRRQLPEEKFQLVLTSDYWVAKRLFMGESSPFRSFMSGQLKVNPVNGFSGLWSKHAAKSVLIANTVLKVARQVPTIFVPGR
jgi:hypothetical protein